jgi:ribosomal protein S18 acetylase RimI-like enzyme
MLPTSLAGLRILRADLAQADHQAAILEMVDLYARDPVGGGKPLPDPVRAGLIPGLSAHPTTVVFLAFSASEAIGVAVCFGGFSTFAAKPLLNIHDLAVHPAYRGRGVGRALLAAVEAHAQATGCCKLTLEVQANNAPAVKAYRGFGFASPSYFVGDGGTLFYVKPLQ